MLYLISITVVPYLIFIFFNEGFNPIVKPRNLAKRRRWRYGHAMAIASLPVSVSSVAMMQTMNHASAQSFAIGIASSALMAIVFSASKISGFFKR